MIEVRNLKKVYKTKKGVEVRALDGVSLKLPATGMVFILGKSGSGKSTLLNVIGGLDSIDEGEILIKGSSCADFKQSHYDSYRNTYIGFIFQEYNILEELTVGANIALAIELQGRRASNEEINAILREVDLEGYGSRKPNELSGGQKQRVAIARALVKKPEIIMADEPTGALDSATGKQVFDTLKRLSRDKLVLIVSHDRDFSERYADRIIELADGKVISDVELSGEGEPSSDASLAYDTAYEAEGDGLSFSDAGITVRAGYQLTESDRLAINDYLRGQLGDVDIRRVDAAPQRGRHFVPTDESRIEIPSGEFKLIKSKLSVKNAFKIGSGALKYKKFRLAFTIFLSLISFTLFGLSDTIAAYNGVETATSSIYDSGVSYASFMKEIKSHYGSGDNDFYWETNDTYLSRADVEKIAADTGLDVVGVFKPRHFELSLNSALGSGADKSNMTVIYSDVLSGLAPIDEAFVNDHGFSLIGEYPDAGEKEIVLTDFMFEYFKLAGYLDLDTGLEVEINTYEDLIGKRIDFGTFTSIGVRTVSGIIDTNFDITRFLPLADDNAQNSMNILVYVALMSELEAARSYSYACLGFVDQGTIDNLSQQSENSAESFNGEFSIGPDDKLVEDGDYYWFETATFFNTLITPDTFGGNIAWLRDGERELSDNEIAVSIERLIELVNMSSDKNAVLWEEKELKGTERVLAQKGYLNCLSDVFHNPTHIAAAAYAYEHNAEVKALLESRDYGTFTTEDEVIQYFAGSSGNAGFIEGLGLSATMTDDYINSVVDRYKLGGMVISKAALDSLYTVKTYGSSTLSNINTSDYYRYMILTNIAWEIDSIIANKYALDNLDDAISFYKAFAGHAGDDSYVIEEYNVYDAINTYIKYIGGEMEAPEGYTPAVSQSYRDFYSTVISDFISSANVLEHLDLAAIRHSGMSSGDPELIRDLEIVGLYFSDSSYAKVDAVMVSEKVANELIGANRGGVYRFAIGNMPTEENDIRDIVKFSKQEVNDAYRFSLQNSVTEELSLIEEILVVLGQVFFYVGIAFAVFSSLMLSNFIGTSIAYKKHDIGILRAIGSRSADVFRIFFAESFIIAMINFVLSAAGTFAVTMLLNGIFRNEIGLLITFLSFGVRQIVLLFGVSLLVAFLATFFPVRKIARRKPIDAIKNLK